MNYKNGFFQIIIKENGTYLRIYPALPGGTALELEEVTKYLEREQIKDYDLRAIHAAIQNTKEVTDIFIGYNMIYSISEKMNVQVTEDKMAAIARFYPPSTGGSMLTRDEILSDLNHLGIRFGINYSSIDRILIEREYCKDYQIAAGQAEIQGKDAAIDYHFNTDRRLKPKLNEDGTVDFHQLDNISHIKAGDVLATLIPEDLGTSGTDVYGNEVKPRKVIKKVLKYGKNIRLSEDGCELISEINGHASLEVDKVFVSNVYEVPADVDNSTGDIFYEGNIVIKGNVRTGFKVQSTGDIEISGVVEGAIIVAGGQIVLKRGIQGMGRGLLQANGNIIAKFIESARVITNGYVETESIMHSNVSAKGEINIRGKKGNLIGGYIRSSCYIEARTIGSSMGTATTVEVGIDPALQDRIATLRKEISNLKEEHAKVSQIVELLRKRQEMLGKLDPDKALALQKALKNLIEVNAKLMEYKTEYKDAVLEIQENFNAKIRVTHDIFPGVKIVILNDFLIINETASHCQYQKLNNEIVSSPF